MGRRPKTYQITQEIVVKPGFRKGHEPKLIAPVYLCTQCGHRKVKEKMIHDRKRGTNHGVGSWCKDCHHAYLKQYRLDHGDEIRAKKRAKYRLQHPKFRENDKLR